MKNWEEKTISALGKVITGKTPPKEDAQYFAGGEELFVSPKDMDWDQFYVTETETKVTSRALEKFKNQVIPRNAIMFTSLSFGFGKMSIASRNCLTNQQINTVVTNNDHDCRFVFYLLKAYKPIIFSYNSGIDTPIVPKSVFEKIGVKVPDLKTQQKIAGILSAYDDLIENNKRRITLLENMAEELYREWFVRFRFPGWREAEFEKGIPKGWENKRFDDFCTLQRGYDLPDSDIEPGDFPVVASTSIKAFHKEFKIKPPIVATGRSGSLGTVQFIQKKAWPLNTCLFVKDFKGNSPYLVYFILKAMRLENFNAGAGVPSLNRNHLAALQLAVPEQAIQQKFDEVIAPIFKSLAQQAELTENLLKTKNALLPRLISGKLAVEDLAVQLPPSMRA